MRRGLLVLLLLALVLPGCGETPREYRPLPSSLGDLRGVAMGFERLLPLRRDEGVYAAWINLDRGDLVVLGAFNVDVNGRPVHTETGEVIDRFPASQNLFSSVSIVITIEPLGIGSGPGSAAILQGPFIDGIAQLSVPAPLGIDMASGSYRVFTPTDGPDTNENSGVWAASENDEALLTLPPLNSVFRYEHYMIIDGVEATMGGFLSADTRDFNNPYSADLPAPDFPGEDFLLNAPAGLAFPTDLSGARLILTLEPVLGDTIDSSQLIVLEATLPPGLQGGEVFELTNQTANFPEGVAVIY